MVVDVAIITQCTMTLTLCISVAWCCDEPVSCILRHPAMSILLHCLMPTGRFSPLLAGQVPRLPRWLPFPQDPHTPPPHPVTVRAVRYKYNKLFVSVSPSARLMYGEYWFLLSRLSMMVIGSFASYTKTKSVESAVWCLLTRDDDVETHNE